ATGPAPLAVTFTAACASSAYQWRFGDGQAATGQSVRHVFRAGVFRPTLTTDAGIEPVATVLSISLRLTGPARARYAQRVTLHASVVPRLPVLLRGRRFINGKLRVRVLGTQPWIATADGVSSRPVHIVAVPKLVVRLVGTPVVGSRLRVAATLHPANAGRVIGPKIVNTAEARVARITVTTRPARGWAAVRQTVTGTIVAPSLAAGAHGTSVFLLEHRLRELHYAVQVDGVYGGDDVEAIYAFQKVNGLPRTGAVDRDLWARLEHARIPRARYPGTHIEVDKTRQVLFVVRGGKVTLIVPTSTGATGNTPIGEWHVYRKVAGYDWVLYYPSYFLRGFAVHGYPDVPPYPASHGCARIPLWIATTVYAQMPDGSTVYVY
ncbi:MAG: L,D-transpeptidase family protein, partial [Gaiellaceae bacterium]